MTNVMLFERVLFFNIYDYLVRINAKDEYENVIVRMCFKEFL